MVLRIFLSLLFIAAVIPHVAFAQISDYSDIPDEFIEEAIAFEQECQLTPKLFKYHSCECLAVKYLDERIKVGPGANQAALLFRLEGECKDATEAAGYYYRQCLGNSPLMPANIPPEEYCTCFANAYAKLFEQYRVGVSSKSIMKIQTQAHLTCRNPSLSKRLYPVQPR